MSETKARAQRSQLASLTLAPLCAGVVLLFIGALAVWGQQAWLAPSLGAAVLLQTLESEQPAARPYSMALGQLLGVVGGFAGVYAVAAAGAPEFLSGHPLLWSRVWAAAIGVVVTAILQAATKAKSPAGGTIALLFGLGAETPDWHGAFLLVVGIILISVLGEAARRFVLRSKEPA